MRVVSFPVSGISRVLLACSILAVASFSLPASAQSNAGGAGPAVHNADTVSGAAAAAETAQTTSTSTQAGTSAAMAALEAQVAALEARIAKLEADASNTDETGKPKPVQAPFTVVDAGGQPLLTVGTDGSVTIGNGGNTIKLAATADGVKISATSGDTVALLEAMGGNPSLILKSAASKGLIAGVDDGGMSLSLFEGSTSVDLSAKVDQPSVTATAGGKSVQIGGTGPTFGFSSTVNSSRVVALGDRGDGTYSLRVYQPGATNPVVQAGVLASGDSGFVVGDGTNQFVRIDGKDGQGVITAFKSDQPAVTVGSTQGAEGLTVYDSSGSNMVFAGSTGENDPNILITKGGHLLASMAASDADATAGAIDVFHGANRRVSLDAGGAAGMRIYAGDNSVLSNYVGTDGEPGILLSHGTSSVVTIGANASDPTSGNLMLLRADKPIFEAGKLSDGGLGLQVVDQGDSPAIDLSVASNGSSGLSFNKGGELRTFVGMGGDGDPLIDLFSGKNLLAQLTDVDEYGALTIYKDGTRALSVGPAVDKTQPAFRAYSDGNMVFAAGATDTGTGAVVTLGGGGIGAGLEADATGNGSVYVNSNGQTAASINSRDEPGKGLVVVRNSSGAAVSTLASDSSGGGVVTASDPSGNGVFSAGYIANDGPGTACVEHKGTKCLGVGLTGMEGFH